MPTYTLQPGEYWKLRALHAELQHVTLEARATVALARKQNDAAIAVVAAAYGFDPTVGTFRLDDDTLTLSIPDPHKELP